MAEDNERDGDGPEDAQGYGPGHADNRDLPRELQGALLHLRAAARKRQTYARLTEVQDAWLQQLIDRGDVDAAWDDDAQRFVSPDGVGGAGADSGTRGATATQENYNLYLGFRKVFNATFCQGGANVQFEAVETGDPGDEARAEHANAYRRVIEKTNDVRAIQAKVGMYFFTDARVVIHTRWEQEGARYGGAQGPRPVITPYGVLQSHVPIASGGMEDWPWCGIETEKDQWTLQERYPWAAQRIGSASPMSAEDETARLARLAVAEGLGDQRQGAEAAAWMPTVGIWYFRTDVFNELEPDTQQEMRRLFPSGVEVTFVGHEYVQACDASMDDHIQVAHALPGPGQKRASIGSPMVAVQRGFDSGMNLAHDTFLYGIPKEIGDPAIIDFAARKNQPSVPGDMEPAKTGMRLLPGDTLDNHFHVEAQSVVNPAMLPWLQNLQGALAQFLTGQLAPVYGGEEPGNETAKGRQLAANMALGLLGLTWQPYVVAWANVMLQAVRCAAKHAERGVTLTIGVGRGRTQQVKLSQDDIEDLNGRLACYPATDENYPRSAAERRAAYLSVLEMGKSNAALSQVLMSPQNLWLGKDLLGLEDLQVPEADAAEKQLDEIGEMLDGPGPQIELAATAVAEAQAQAAGQPSPEPVLRSSVPLGPFDDDAAELAAGKSWLNDPQRGVRARRKKPAAYQDIVLHLRAHQARLLAAQQEAQEAQAAKAAAKPPSESFSVNYRDLPAEVQRQLLAGAGFQVTLTGAQPARPAGVQ